MGAAQCGPAACCKKDSEDSIQDRILVKVPARSASAWAEDVEEEVSPSAPKSTIAQVKEPAKSSAAAAAKEPPCSVPEKDNQSQPEVPPAFLKDGEMMVSIERSANETIGLNLDLTDGMSLVIAEIVEGIVETWNAERTGEACLQVHDRIVEVNGARGNVHVLMSMLKQHKVWRIVVQKPTPVRVEVERSSAVGLGVDLRYAPNGESLVISNIDEGPVKAWSAKNPKWKIKVNDRVAQVNACRGNAKELLHAGLDRPKVTLEILVYPPT